MIKSFASFAQNAPLKEGKEGKLSHLEHLEDNIINLGVVGAEEAIDTLYDLGQQMAGEAEANIEISVKFDGAPAIICGVNPENRKFFVGTKGVFAKESKACYTPKDVKIWYQGELAAKLIAALAYLPACNIKGVIQGDFMFGPDPVETTDMEGQECFVFRPNTISYAVPTSSKLGKEIEQARIGIVFHTKYVGDTMEDMQAEFGLDVGELTKTPKVWFIGATYKDETGVTQLSTEETNRINAYLNMARGSLKKSAEVLNHLKDSLGRDAFAIGPRMKVYFNSRVRNDKKFVNVKDMQLDFEQYYLNSLKAEEAKKSSAAGQAKFSNLYTQGQEFFNNHRASIYMAIATYCSIHNAKNLIINKLNRMDTVKAFLEVKPGVYKVTAPEGFVAIKGQKAVKLVDRFSFSQANFNMTKNWDKGTP